MVADKLLKDPRDVKERAALEVFIARELYGLSLAERKEPLRPDVRVTVDGGKLLIHMDDGTASGFNSTD